MVRKDKPAATWTEIALVLAAGFLGNIALRTTVGGLGAAIGSALVVVLVFRRTQQRTAYVPLALAVALIPWLSIRSNPMLTFVTITMIGALLFIAGGFSMRGSFFDARLRSIASHVFSPVYEWAFGGAMVQRLIGNAAAEQRALPLLRGVVAAVPVLIVFTALLASADGVFAKLVQLDNLPDLVAHVLITAVVVVPVVSILSRSAHALESQDANALNVRIVGPVEIMVVLGSLASLFAVFVVLQLVVALGGADHVLETEGLTQADHARRGFFQLLWVAGLSTSLVGGLRSTRSLGTQKERDWFVPLALVTLALTIVIAAISVQRLLLYIGSFGLTQSRLWALVAAGAIGVGISLFATSIVGWRKDQSWLPGALIVLAASVVFVLNLMNPDAIVASYNLSNQTDVDVVTISRLSDDAVPTILGRLDEAPAELAQSMCGRRDRFSNYGLLDYNWAEVRADNMLDDLCGQRSLGSGFWDDLGD